MSKLKYFIGNKTTSKYILYGREAYEAWHLYYYLKQIYNFDKKIKSLIFDKKIKSLIKDKYLILIILLKITKAKKFLELGGSIFETITGLEFINKKLNLNIKIKSIKFINLEISNFFKWVAKKINNKYRLLEKNNTLFNKEKFDLAYDRMVSSYAFKSEKKLLMFIKSSKVTFCNLAVYKNFNNSTFKKNFIYKYNDEYRFKIFNLDLLQKLIKNSNNTKLNGYYIFGKKHPSPSVRNIVLSKECKIHRLDGFFIFCDKSFLKKFSFMINKYYVKFFNKKITPIAIENLKKKNFY